MRSIPLGKFLLALMLPLLGIGCAPERAWNTTDPWFDAPRESIKVLSPLESERIDVVADPREADAEAMLLYTPFVELTPRQAEQFAGLPLRLVRGSRPYLFRAVYLNSNGVFQVYHTRGNGLFIIHECLGNHTTTMKRQALILQLDEPPKRVWVVCHMTE